MLNPDTLPASPRASLTKERPNTAGISGSNTSLFPAWGYSVQEGYLFRADTLPTPGRNALGQPASSRALALGTETGFLLSETPVCPGRDWKYALSRSWWKINPH